GPLYPSHTSGTKDRRPDGIGRKVQVGSESEVERQMRHEPLIEWSRWECALSIERIHEEIRKMKPGWGDPESDGYKALIVMYAALNVGQDVSRLSRFTGYPEELITTIKQRLRLALLWEEGDLFNIDHWFSESDLDFFLDSMVAIGEIRRPPDGRYQHGDQLLDRESKPS